MLQSVVLFDSLNTDFHITYILKLNSESWEKVPVQATADQGVASLLNYKMAASDKLQVKVSHFLVPFQLQFVWEFVCGQVTAKPRPGLLGQLIIFQFGSFHVLQCMVVRTISENEEKLLKPKSHNPSRPDNM